MLWTVWALLLVGHGAYSRWARTASRYAVMSTVGDALLIAIGLITLSQLQGLNALDFARVGLAFVVFGVAGRQLMNSVLQQAALKRVR